MYLLKIKENKEKKIWYFLAFVFLLFFGGFLVLGSERALAVGVCSTPGATRVMYLSTSVACGTACLSEIQTCVCVGYDCAWTGTYTQTSCSASTRTRYQKVGNSCGYYCTSETQYCQSNGSWSGTYTDTSCTPYSQIKYCALTSSCGTYGYSSETQYCQPNGSFSPSSCTLSSPPSVTTRTRYAALTSSCGTYGYSSETQYCQSNGTFSGSYTLTSPPSVTSRVMYCAQTSSCGVAGYYSETQYCQSNGGWSPNNCSYSSPPSITTRTRYCALTSSCGTYGYSSETQYCQLDGSWSGSCSYSSPPSPTSRVRYNVSSTCGGVCDSEVQTCQSNGSWYPNNFSYSSCTVLSPTTWYRDADGDGYGNPSVTTSACSQPSGYVSNSSDCNDSDASKWRYLTGYQDADNDGWTVGSAQSVCSGSSLPSGWRSSANGTDCDDNNSSIYPGTTRTRYQPFPVSCGTACQSEVQTCQTNGTWSGSYTQTSCSPSTRTGYYNYTSACGVYSCSGPVTEICTLSGWSPDYPTSCSVSTRTMYQSSSVCSPNSCTSETQTCQSNGSWSGTYTNSSCSVVSCVPAAPTNLTSPDTYSQYTINLTWTDNATNETGYRVYRNSSLIATLGANSTSYSDAVTCGTNYSYYVEAYNSYGSAVSNTFSRTTLPCPPSAPTGLSATPVSQTQINISWNTSAGATGYRLFRNGSEIANITATNYSDTNLSCGTNYSYYVVAYNSGGSSSNSNSAATATDQCTPGTPTIGSASAGGPSTCTISWTRNSPLTESGFKIYDSGGTERGSAGSGAISGTASGLSAATSYSFYVKAYVTTNGRTYYSGNSGSVSCITTPSAPSWNTLPFLNQVNEVAMIWNSVTGAVGYRLYRNGSLIYDGAGTSKSDSNLAYNTTYTYYVTAYNSGGESPASDSFSITTANPNNTLTVSSVTDTTVSISWTNTNPSFPLANLVIYRDGAEIYNALNSGQSMAITSFTDTGLSPGTTHSYYIFYAYNNKPPSSGPFNLTSNTVSATTKPSAPTGLSATPVSQTQINISWSASSGATGYKIYRNGSQIANITTTSYSDTGLSCGTNYSYYVVAYNAGGESSASQTLSASTYACISAPTRVSSVSAVEESRGEVGVNWSSTTADGYKIYLKGGRNNYVYPVADTSNTSTISTVQGGCPGVFTVYVIAYNNDPYMSGVDSSCQNVYESLGIEAPANKKCSLAATTTVILKNCTGGFFLE